MNEHLKNLVKSYTDSLEDHGTFYVYTLEARFGNTDISRVELKVSKMDLMSDVNAIYLDGYRTCTDGTKERFTRWVAKSMIGVPRFISKTSGYLLVEMAVPKLVVEEPGGELAVCKEILSFVSRAYLKPEEKQEPGPIGFEVKTVLLSDIEDGKDEGAEVGTNILLDDRESMSGVKPIKLM